MTYEEIKAKVESLIEAKDTNGILDLFTFDNTKTVRQGQLNAKLKAKRYEFLRGEIKQFSESTDEELETMINGNFK